MSQPKILLQDSAGDWVFTRYQVSFTGVQVPLLGANPNRWSILWYGSNGGVYYVCDNPIGALQRGYIVSNNQPTPPMTYDDIGGLVMQPWYGFGNFGLVINYTEITYLPTGG